MSNNYRFPRAILALALTTAKAQADQPKPHVTDDSVERWACVSCYFQGREYKREYTPVRTAPIAVVYGECYASRRITAWAFDAHAQGKANSPRGEMRRAIARMHAHDEIPALVRAINVGIADANTVL